MAKPYYDGIIVNDRLGETTTERSFKEDFTSDKTRIIFSSPFRRLQQKAQVFSLETNASVRSRLTHTLEVATIGSTIAEKIVDKLCVLKLISKTNIVPFLKIVENCCLLHDIGNPPFGHFAENAIKEWFKKNWEDVFLSASKFEKKEITGSLISTELINDFLNFDGNPQGIRIIVKLHDLPDQHDDVGMNMTFSQIASQIKYVPLPKDVNKKNPLYKKAGYFYSEKEKIEKIKKTIGLNFRYPLTYIMEAADDISYCLSDIEDGIEKKIITARYFFEKFHFENCKKFENENYFLSEFIKDKITKNDFFKFKIQISRELMNNAVERFINNQDSIKEGTLYELIDKDSHVGKLLACLKTIARKYLFRSKEAENKELAGHHAIYGILDKYKSLLEIESGRFFDLVNSKNDLNNVLGANLDLEWRLFNRLPEKYIDAYRWDCLKAREIYSTDINKFKEFEWFYRAHLIVDYISGMTDNYVIETFNLLYGIKIQ